MKKNTEYLLKYISNETYDKILKNTNAYILDNLETNRRDVELNIKYLIKYGIKNIDNVVYDRLEDLTLSHNTFISIMEKYEQSLGKDGFISMIENIQKRGNYGTIIRTIKKYR